MKKLEDVLNIHALKRLGLLSVSDISGVHFMINHDSTLVNELGPTSIVTLDVDHGQVLHFSNREEETSSRHEFLGFLQPANAIKDTTWFISIPVALSLRSAVKLHISYEYFVSDTRFTGAGVVRLVPIPERFALHQNYPNPFNPTTTIEYDLPKDAYVKLVIYDILGREVVTLVDEPQNTGYRSVKWQGNDKSGILLSSGIYIYRITAGYFNRSKMMLLIK